MNRCGWRRCGRPTAGPGGWGGLWRGPQGARPPPLTPELALSRPPPSHCPGECEAVGAGASPRCREAARSRLPLPHPETGPRPLEFWLLRMLLDSSERSKRDRTSSQPCESASVVSPVLGFLRVTFANQLRPKYYSLLPNPDVVSRWDGGGVSCSSLSVCVYVYVCVSDGPWGERVFEVGGCYSTPSSSETGRWS